MDELMTIDELAREAGTTTRNVRAYQTRGLLPAPKLRGRVGYYDRTHLARLRTIAALQERGFSLASIDALIRAWEEGRGLNQVLGFEEVLTTPWSNQPEERMTREDLAQLFPEVREDDGLLKRAIDLQLVIPDGDAFRVPSSRLVRMGADLVSMGIPLSAALDVAAELRKDADQVAQRFVAMFSEYVWAPFEAEGMPPEQLAEVTKTLQRLRPMASAAVDVALAEAMDRHVAAAAANQITSARRRRTDLRPTA